MLHGYQAKDIGKCFGNRSIVYLGDSTMRQLFWATARKIDSSAAQERSQTANRHANLSFPSTGGGHVRFIWDPYLNSSTLRYELTSISDVSSHGNAAALLVIGGGLWHAKYLGDLSTKDYKYSLENITKSMHLNTSQPHQRNSEEPLVLFAPVFTPWYDSLNSSTSQSLSPSRIESLNEELRRASIDNGLRVLWSFSLMTYKQKDAYDVSGIHATKSIAELMVDVILNLDCNSRLSLDEKYPMDKTCCHTYVLKNFAQLVVMIVAITLPVIGFFWERSMPHPSLVARRRGGQHLCVNKNLSLRNAIDALQVLLNAACYCALADRTSEFEKLQKRHNSNAFITLSSLSILVGLLCFRPSTSVSRETALPDLSTSDEILSRKQTEEWKGWMQLLILIYHYTGASRVLWTYKIIRLLVASYLFLSGFGHASFFLQKSDFSLKRAASTLLRLNLLSCLLPYAMATDYLYYYFAPLISFWYIVIYLTMRIGHHRNRSQLFVLTKLAVAALTTTLVINHPLVFDTVFRILGTYAKTDWNSREWRFRLQLDSYIVYVGMLVGIVVQNGKKPMEKSSKQSNLLFWATRMLWIMIPLLTLVIYVPIFKGTNTKATYNGLHPYISFLPILCFVLLRNGCTLLRKSYSSMFAWVGRHSLETFTLQFHIWLAADTKGLLSTGLFEQYVIGASHHTTSTKNEMSLWGDFTLISILFLFMSWRVAKATQSLTEWIIEPEKTPRAVGDVHKAMMSLPEEYDDEGLVAEPEEQSMTSKPGLGALFLAHVHKLLGRIVHSLKGRLTLILLCLWLSNLVSFMWICKGGVSNKDAD